MKRYKISALVAMLFLPCLHLKAQENNTDFWVGRYMSVSYPLKQIKINSHFGWRKDPFTGKRRLHKGIDLDTAHDPVMAMFDGYVQDIGSDGGNGNYIVLNHGDYTVCYCHLSRITTVKDAQVKAGDIVGISGSTGRSTGDHLHLTSRYKGELRDPYTLLQYITSTKEICVKLLAMKGLPSDSEDIPCLFCRGSHGTATSLWHSCECDSCSDGAENGEFENDTINLEGAEAKKIKEGKGWFNGAYEVNVDVKLKKK